MFHFKYRLTGPRPSHCAVVVVWGWLSVVRLLGSCLCCSSALIWSWVSLTVMGFVFCFDSSCCNFHELNVSFSWEMFTLNAGKESHHGEVGWRGPSLYFYAEITDMISLVLVQKWKRWLELLGINLTMLHSSGEQLSAVEEMKACTKKWTVTCLISI